MNIKLAVTVALFSAAISSASPALATEVARMDEQPSPCNCEDVLVHKPIVMTHAAKLPLMLHYAAPKMQQDGWPGDLILGSFESRSEPYALKVAV